MTHAAEQQVAPRLEWIGDTALRLVFDDDDVARANMRVHALDHRLRALAIDGVRDLVPAMTSLTVHLDTPRVRLGTLLRAVETMDTASTTAPDVLSSPRTHVIPVTYGGANGPDLPALARMTGLTEAAIVMRHRSLTYRVCFLGFRPGFPYLGPLPDALRVPRRATPRARVPAGAVAMADAFTGIYPEESPGGWHVIGRTDVVLFDAHREAPSLLQAGDTVRFVEAG